MNTTTNITPEEVQKLRNAVNTMDSLSQDGFSQIAAIAKLALNSLETLDGNRDMDSIAHALNIILGKADYIQDRINIEAEEVGCNYVDDTDRRRSEARRAAHRQDAADHQRRNAVSSSAFLERAIQAD